MDELEGGRCGWRMDGWKERELLRSLNGEYKIGTLTKRWWLLGWLMVEAW